MSLEFKTPQPNDKEWVSEIFDKSTDDIGFESAFGGIYLWGSAYNTKICRFKNTFLKIQGTDNVFYGMPIGTDDSKEIFSILEKDALNRGINFKLTGITQNDKGIIERDFPDKFEFIPRRDTWDYIYYTKDLVYLKGKKYHSKRNHITKFKKLYPYESTTLTPDNAQQCLDFTQKWFIENLPQKNIKILHEYTALEKALCNLEKLGLTGAILKVGKDIVAFTLGEPINSEVFLIHFEKASKEYHGAYSVINNEFSKKLFPRFLKINREEDLGIPGLRKSKFSYYPCEFVKKYDAFLKQQL